MISIDVSNRGRGVGGGGGVLIKKPLNPVLWIIPEGSDSAGDQLRGDPQPHSEGGDDAAEAKTEA